MLTDDFVMHMKNLLFRPGAAQNVQIFEALPTIWHQRILSIEDIQHQLSSLLDDPFAALNVSQRFSELKIIMMIRLSVFAVQR
jgi:hypothetical protein